MVSNFLADLSGIAPIAGTQTYAFTCPLGERTGYVQIISESHNEVTIHRIWTLAPRSGHGSAILRKVCEIADRHGIILKLRALPFGAKPFPLSRDQLFDWYSRYGFEGKRRKMIRLPRPTRPPAEHGKSRSLATS
jgi:hypothetical protein